jgi:hypothetical protein
MDSRERRFALRAAVYRGDGPAVVDLRRGVGADDDSLQLAGDGAIAGVMQRVDGAAGLAGKLVVGLRQRCRDGDDELADQLEAQLGSGPAAMLRASPVDLEGLAGILEGDRLRSGRIDIRTGEVWPQAATNTRWRPGRRTRTPLMIPGGGWRSTARAHARATGPASAKGDVARPGRGRPQRRRGARFRGGLLAAAEVADAAPDTALTPEGPCCARLRRCPDCPGAEVSSAAIAAPETAPPS